MPTQNPKHQVQAFVRVPMATKATPRNKKPVDVHVRIRPMIEGELERQDQPLDFDIATTRDGMHGIAFQTPKTELDDIDFVEVLGGFRIPKAKPRRDKAFHHLNSVHQNVSNATFYQATVQPLLAEALAGRTGCCFAYGHTGSGKTHTILGYGDELGMYHLAMKQLIDAIATRNLPSIDRHDHLKIQVRFNEIYNGDVYDLLNDGAKCFVREDGHGKVQIRSETSVDEATGLVKTAFSSSHLATTEEELLVIVRQGLANRATGNSNVHSASSRSHALLQLELVSDRILELRQAVVETEAALGRCGYERDRLDMDIFVRQHDKLEGKWIKRADAVPSTAEECAQLLAYRKRYKELEKEIVVAKAAVEAAMGQGVEGLGGHLVFVDLAGSEHAGRVTDGIQKTEEEQQECREINKSLSALRACFRAQAMGQQSLSCYRESKLTLALRDHLRSHGGSHTIMIAAISPSSYHVTKTIHTLQYAQLVGEKV